MQQNRWIICSIGLLVVIASAFATTGASADGYQRPPGVVPVAGCARFGGFYVGGNIGWATLTAHQNDLDGYFSGAPTSFTATDDTFTAGAQFGYNLQKGCTVFGIEADWNWADLSANTRLFPLSGFDDRLKTRIDNFGTIRTRTGIVVDRLLLFVTGGVAWTETRDSVRRLDLVDERFSSNDTRWGWTAGFGTEYALAPGVSLTSDVLYLSFGDEEHTFNSPAFGGRFRTKTDEEIWVARMGLNIRFGDRGAIVMPPLK
jgi:outer membrane immunogenic protein